MATIGSPPVASNDNTRDYPVACLLHSTARHFHDLRFKDKSQPLPLLGARSPDHDLFLDCSELLVDTVKAQVFCKILDKLRKIAGSRQRSSIVAGSPHVTDTGVDSVD